MHLIRGRYNQTRTKNEKDAPKDAAREAGHSHKPDLILEIAARAAVHHTNASAAAIALLDNGTLVCRASVGRIAPDLGMRLDVNSGITGACVRSKAVMHCVDTESDRRVDALVCRTLGIRSVLVVPVLAGSTVVGVVEVLSAKDSAFKAEHIQWLLKLAEFLSRMSASPVHEATEHELLPLPESAAERQRDAIIEPTTDHLPPDGSTAVSADSGLAAFLSVLPKSSQSSTWDEMSEALTARMKVAGKS